MLVFNCYLKHEVYMLYKHQAASLLALMEQVNESPETDLHELPFYSSVISIVSINEIKQETTN